MLAVTVEFDVKADRVDDFRAAVFAQATNSLKEEDACHQFDVCFDDDNPNIAFLYELYDDEAAFQQHLKTPHFAEFDATVSDWVVKKSVRTWTRQEI